MKPALKLRNLDYPAAQRDGFRGDYIDWLEAELTELRRRHEQLVDSVECLGPHLAAAVLSGVRHG